MPNLTRTNLMQIRKTAKNKTQIYPPFLYKFAAVKPNLNAYLRIYSCFSGIIAKISQRMKNDDKKNYFARRVYHDDADGLLH
ncbi:hypothetical protein [Campylobacter showae]|uniref:hypothetical protein n=2 Tax=Campylobacter showae TaxID=204 RepID=UPI0013D0D2FD|nr:hypothetical protein [Campylobacter showae]